MFQPNFYHITSFNNCHSHFNIINWSVSTSSSSALYHFNHINTFLDLAKYGVLTVKMWGTADAGIYLQLFLCQSSLANLFLSFCNQFLLQFLKSVTIPVSTHLHNFSAVFCCKFIESRPNLLHPQLFGELAELSLIIYLPPDDIELRTAASTLWINFIALSCSSQSSTFMEKTILNLCFKCIARISHTKHLSCRCVF